VPTHREIENTITMALPYELESLDTLISDNLHPKHWLHEKTTPELEKQLLIIGQQANDEINKFRKRLKPVAYGFEKEKHRELFIRQHISALTHLLDTLTHFLMPGIHETFTSTPGDSQLCTIYKSLYLSCHETFEELQTGFSQYCNYDHKIPDHEWTLLQHKWSNEIKIVKQKLTKFKTDKSLIEMLLAYLYNITDSSVQPTICRRKMRYLNDLLIGISNLKQTKRTSNQCPPITTLLVYLDFNTTEFKDYLVDFICENAGTLTDPKARIERLSFFYKQISQMHIRPGATLRPASKSVKEDLKDWLAREIKYQEKTHTIGFITPATFNQDVYNKGIWYNYSIEEMALFKRIEHEAGLITNKKIRPMIEDFAKIAHISSQHNISSKNLYNLFYNIELSTINSLHDKLFLLINQLQKIKSQAIQKQKEKITTKRKVNKS
jgi:hypothetical protein